MLVVRFFLPALPRLALLSLVALLGGCQRDAPTTPPILAPGEVSNVLLITIDTLRADALGYAGGKVETPVIDRLAAQGRVYWNAHAHNVVTLPSHANILAGLYPYQHGIRENSGFVLPPSIPTMATHLAAAGFATGAVVGAFPLDARYGLNRGFQVYDDRYPVGSNPTEFSIAERRGDEVVRLGLAWWRQNLGKRRFLWVHLYDPHTPYMPPEPFASRYPGEPYFGEVAATDAFLRPLLEPFLEGREEPTLILFTADHGESLGQHGELTHGFFAYEPTLKVPLILWAPGIARGEVTASVRHIDLLPTVLEALELPMPPDLPGRSLVRDPPSDEVENLWCYFEALSPNLNRGWAPLRGVLQGVYKFISVPIPELYNLEEDPEELHNLFDQERRRANQMATLLPEESVWPPPRAVVSDEEAALFRSLGYLTGFAEAKKVYTAEDDPKNLVHLDQKLHNVIHLFHERKLEEATELAREVVEERPMALGYAFLAQVLLEQGRLQEAIQVMEEARAQQMAKPSLARQLALSLAEAGRPQEAVELLQPLAETGDVDSLNALGFVLSEAGRQREAREVLLQVAARHRDNPVTHQHLALVALREGNWPEARAQAQTALERNEHLTLAWNYLGAALYNLNQPRDALAAWQRAVTADATNFDALYNIAVVAVELGELAQAREALQRFVASAPPRKYGPDIQKARVWLRQLGG